MKFRSYLAAGTMMLLAFPVCAAEPAGADSVREAVQRGLAVVQKSAANYPKHRACFSCHHQTLPMLAMVTARDQGTAIDRATLQSQADFTHTSFAGRVKDMKEGTGIGGRSMTVGYGLWTLDLADRKADETTEAMVTYLLKNQTEDGHWARQTSRPPLEDSNVTCTVLAAYGLKKYAAASQRDPATAAITKAKTWLTKATLESQEDRVARLWGICLLGGEPKEMEVVRAKLLAAQHDDGGWPQRPTMSSDAYATGQTLFVLRLSGLSVTEPAYQRGVKFLLSTQCGDGSWKVETRSRPIQTYFDNGDPHGKHQFISIPATGWAVTALALSLDKAVVAPLKGAAK